MIPALLCAIAFGLWVNVAMQYQSDAAIWIAVGYYTQVIVCGAVCLSRYVVDFIEWRCCVK